MSSGAMYSNSSGMPSTAMRLPRSWGRNLAAILDRCAASITRIVSAQTMSSADTGQSASWPVPADAVSMPGQSANTCSAVGLRKRFLPQTKRTLWVKASPVA